MKNIVVLSYFFFFSSLLLSQEDTASWQKMMMNPDYTFFEVQTAFEAYWSGKNPEKGKGYKQFKRWERYMTPRVGESGNQMLPMLTYTNFQEWEKKYLKNNANLKSYNQENWSPIGPIGNAPNSGNGRVNFIRFHPTNNAIIFIGAPDGGLWKTENGGDSWTPLTDQLTMISCSDLVIDPQNPDIMYLATGDGDGYDNPSTGVIKSLDGGVTWANTGLVFTFGQWRKIGRLIMHPTNNQIIFAATTSGIYRTTNGGTNWNLVKSGNYQDMEMKPNDPTTWYASGNTFIRSTNEGATFTTVTSGLPTSGVSRISLAVTTGNNSYVYLVIGRSSDEGLLGVYRSEDSGISFEGRYVYGGSNTIHLLGGNSDGTDPGGQAWYDLVIQANSVDPESIVVGGVNTWKSDNGGTSWALNSHWWGDAGAPYVHADVHAIENLPNSSNTYFICHDGGISKTENAGNSFVDINSNLCISQQYDIAITNLNVNKTITGHQDNGTYYNNNGVWSEVYGGDGMDCFFDRNNENTLFVSWQQGRHLRSSDNGLSWIELNNNIPIDGSETTWNCRIHQDPIEDSTIYASGRVVLYKSTDFGNTWNPLGPTGSNSHLQEFVVAKTNNQIIYAHTDSRIVKSIDGGVTWSIITPIANSESITYIEVSPTNPDIVWFCTSGYNASNKVFKSIDGGVTWIQNALGLPNIPANCIRYQPNTPNDLIYVGMDAGVFWIDNTQTSWQPFLTGLPRCEVSEIDIVEPTSKIRVATFGRGTWESNTAVSILAPPVANFSSANTICANNTITLNDASTYAPISWEWSISPTIGWVYSGGTTANSVNPSVTFSSIGNYTVTLIVTNALGADTLIKPDHIEVINPSSVAIPLIEDFNSFVPFDWSIPNTNGGGMWDASTVGNTANAAMFNNFDIEVAFSMNDELVVKPISLVGAINPKMTFDVAYAPYNGSYSDGLEVWASSDCGGTFINLYSKFNLDLATAPAIESSFEPSGASEWRKDTVELNSFIGESNVILKFVNKGGWGNKLYIDNVNINSYDYTSLSEESAFLVEVYPNPAKEKLIVRSSVAIDEVSFSDLTGKKIPIKYFNSFLLSEIQLPKLAAGIYFLQLQGTNGSVVVREVIIE